MKKSILKSTAFCLGAGLLCCLLLTALIVDHRSLQQMKEHLCRMVTVLAETKDVEPATDENAKKLSALAGGMRITLIGTDGTVLADSEGDHNAMENHTGRREFQQAMQNGTAAVVHRSELTGQRMMYAAAKTDYGYIRAATPCRGFGHALLSLLPAFLFTGLVAFAAAAALSSRTADTVLAPVANFAKSLKSVQQGGVKLDPQKYPYEELRTMAGNINGMSEEIARNMRRLERERTKINYILDNMNEGFVLLDTQQNILLINEAACRCFRAEKKNVQGKNILHATRSVPVVDGVAAVLEKGGHVAVDLPLPDKKKGEVNISRVLPEDTGAIDGGVILIITDVTAQRNAAKMRQEFFESASHELKTPITSIKGFAELLCSDMPLGGNKHEELSKRILKETVRMSSLISDIIMISRLESGDIMFERELIDLADVVDECCADAGPLAEMNHVAIHCSVQPSVISASHREMRELTGNLISNAVKYNRPGGYVDVRLENQNNAPVLTVFNTGEPIAREYLERIFERFFRIDRGRSKAAGGTGLGLAIVKHIATNYGASVSVAASEKGNTFIVKFPVQE